VKNYFNILSIHEKVYKFVAQLLKSFAILYSLTISVLFTE